MDNFNILIVEDNNINRRIISNIIKSLGFEPIEAENGQKALAILDTTEVAYILMDLMMPVMDGYEASRKIKETKDTPIIAISADQYSHLTDRMIDAKIDAVLSKPINKDDLLQTMYALNEKKESNTDTYTIFNKRAFEQFLTDESVRLEIAKTFIDEEPNDSKRLNIAFESENLDTIYNAVHYMKGSFSYIKANTLFELSKVILDQCKNKNLQKVLSYQDELLKKYNQLLTELKSYIAN